MLEIQIILQKICKAASGGFFFNVGLLGPCEKACQACLGPCKACLGRCEACRGGQGRCQACLGVAKQA